MACSKCQGNPPSGYQCTGCGAGEMRMPKSMMEQDAKRMKQANGGCAVTGVLMLATVTAVGAEAVRWLA